MGDMQAVYKDTMETSKLNDHAMSLVNNGYNSFKVVFIPFTHYTNSISNLKKVHDLMSSLRKTVGDDIDIMVDFHGRCGSGISAIQYIKELEPYNPMFVEEPILPGDDDTFLQIKNSINCPLATGERLIGQQEFEQLIFKRAVDIIQPDLNHCGGLLEAKNIAAAAAVANIDVSCRGTSSFPKIHFDIKDPILLKKIETLFIASFNSSSSSLIKLILKLLIFSVLKLGLVLTSCPNVVINRPTFSKFVIMLLYDF